MFSAGLAAKLVGIFADEGAEPKDLNLLAEKPWLVKRMIDVIRNKSEIKDIDYYINFDYCLLLPDGLRLGQLPGSVGGSVRFNSDQGKNKLYLTHLQMSARISRARITGKMLLEEFRKIESKVLLGIQLLHFYLSHPQLIPANWENEKIFFWGTICRDYGNKLYVPFMFYNGKEWESDFRCLDLNFDYEDSAIVFDTLKV